MTRRPLTAAQLAAGAIVLDHASAHVFNADPELALDASFDTQLLLHAVQRAVKAEHDVVDLAERLDVRGVTLPTLLETLSLEGTHHG